MATENKYAVQLDGVRFIAVFMVMVAHWAQWQFSSPVLTEFPFVHGVLLFFVLSGFLITRILLQGESGQTSKSRFLRNFYIRRFIRIFPLYYLLIVVLFILNYKNTRIFFPWLISFTTNIYQSIYNEYVGDFNHFWSLAVEEQFYLLWPLVILFLPHRKVLAAILSTIILSIAFRVMVYATNGNWMMLSYSTPGCMYALGIGGLLAYLTLYKPQIIHRFSHPLWLYGTVAVYLASLWVAYRYQCSGWKLVGDELLFSLAAALAIYRAASGKFTFGMKFFLENRFVNYGGKISYGLYVFHLLIPSLYYFVFPKIGVEITKKYTLFIVFFLLTYAVAHLSWKMLEEPLNKLKSRFPYSG